MARKKKSIKKTKNKPASPARLAAKRAGGRPKTKDRNSGISVWQSHSKSISISFALITIIGGLSYYFVFKDLPSPYELKRSTPPTSTIIRALDGTVLYRVYNQANRTQLTFDEIPDIVKNSTIAIEDANFYNHWGVDLKAIASAFIHNLKQEDMKSYQGASTIPQQLVKNRLLSFTKTYDRKLKEIILSVWAEAIYSKEEILTMYLNTVGYGGPAYGIEAAAQTYFDKSAKNLTLAEAAFLAGLPAAPTTFSPYGTSPEMAYFRQQQVLERMLKLGMIEENK